MEKLIFRTFSWPQNPDKYQVNWVREPVYEKDEKGDTVFAGMGDEKCVITGSGTFFGETAYADFRKLVTLFREGSCGTLNDPTWGNFNVYLTKLEAEQEPRSDYVAYSFEFTLANANGEIPK